MMNVQYEQLILVFVTCCKSISNNFNNMLFYDSLSFPDKLMTAEQDRKLVAMALAWFFFSLCLGVLF